MFVLMSKFDVGICAYNEEKNVDKLLKALLTENFKNKLGNIYVVCSGCTDNTEGVVKKYSETFPNTILIHEDERCGKPSAINKILSQKLAPLLIFIAADNIPKRGSIDKLLTRFKDVHIGGVNGHPIPVNGFKYANILWIVHHYYLMYEDKSNKLQHFTGEFCAFRPLFSEMPLDVLLDDAWMAMTLRGMNYKITYEKDAISYFKTPTNIFEYVKQRTRNLWGHSQIQQRSLMSILMHEPIYALTVVIAALRETGFRSFLYMLFLEIICKIKSKLYKRGNIWEKIQCETD